MGNALELHKDVFIFIKIMGKHSKKPLTWFYSPKVSHFSPSYNLCNM